LTIDQLDIEGLLGFAESVLLNAGRLWEASDGDQRQRLQWALFPNGLVFSDGKIETGLTCLAFSDLAGFSGEKNHLASPPGLRHIGGRLRRAA
jgi:hypothetical protein